MKRALLTVALAGTLCSVVLARTADLSGLLASVAAFNEPRALYTTEDESLVSAIAGSILNIAAFADRFDEGDPFQVRNVAQSGSSARFTLQRRAEVFTVEVGSHVWEPRAYGRLARSFMADGAGMTISEDPVTLGRGVIPASAITGDALAAENLRLSRVLQLHPRSSSLHERAALLLALAAAEQATAEGDIRPYLCRMTAHLAVARALHGDALSEDGRLAERLLAQLADREAAVERPARLFAGPAARGPVSFAGISTVSILPAF